ncbi:MAG: hypothetical protein LIO92_03690 [Clostridiales bacterium]|nr:hypothetical protein [Clostridiales bacterium]
MKNYGLMKKIAAFTSGILLAASVLGMTAFAAVPDTTRTGSITVTMVDESTGSAVAGGTLTTYQVGEVYVDDGNYSFVLTDAFADSGVSLTDLDTQDLSALASTLSTYVSDNSLEGTTVTIGSDGIAAFSDLTLGLYLIVQNTSASGYYAISPFLVSVPTLSDGVYVYDINATPKTEPLKTEPTEPAEEPTEPVEEPTEPAEEPTESTEETTASSEGSSGGSSSHHHSSGGSSGGSSSSSSGGSSSSSGPGVSSGDSGSSGESDPGDPGTSIFPILPQTGQLNWPIPVLTLCGLAVFALGWKLFFGGKKHLGQEA